MGVYILQIRGLIKAVSVLLLMIVLMASGQTTVFGAQTPGIDDDTVITAEQAGSIAVSVGDYGWDSRGAVFDYYSQDLKLQGSLGRIMFFDRTGKSRPFLWDEWGSRFPEWWGRMLAERIRSEASDDMIPIIRTAFAEYVTFNCQWLIAIGTKSSVTGRLYKTLRSDGTLRPVNGNDILTNHPEERLFSGDQMASSLSAILPHEEWGSASQAVFRERNPYRYDVRIRSFDVVIRATNCVQCAGKGLPSGSSECLHVENGTFFNDEVPILYNGRSYSGVQSFAWEGQTVNFDEPEYTGYVRKPSGDDKSRLNGVMSRNSITPSGSSELFLFYEKAEEQLRMHDLTIKYVILKSSGTSVQTTVKTVVIPNGIAEGKVFSITLDDRLSENGQDYRLIPGADTALSYASTHKFANAVKGINAYRIKASESADGKIVYATNVPYEQAADGLLYVPVEKWDNSIEVGGSIEFPEKDPNTGALPGSSEIISSITDISGKLELISDIFDVPRAIPSTEHVYVNASFMSYLYSLNASVISGSYPIRVSVIFPYTRTWTENEEEKSDSGIQSVTVTVYREYSYIHLNSFAYYVPEIITAGNPAMEPEIISFSPEQAGITAPVCMTPISYGGGFAAIGRNIDLPPGCPSSLTASTVAVSGGDSPPDIPEPDMAEAYSLVESAVGRMQCRNDEIIFSGINILGSRGWHSYSGQANANTLILSPRVVNVNSKTVYGEKYAVIPATKRNGLYRSNVGVIKYKPVITYSASISYDPVVDVNPVAVHTPVICTLRVEECDTERPNISFDQEIETPDASVMQAVIGRSLSYGMEGHENDSCDFYLSIDNSGLHSTYSYILGNKYDYFYNRSGSEGGHYVRSNEVFFPFDVYQDVNNDWNVQNDILLKGGSWYELAGGRQRFYLPDYVKVDDYCIEARTTAVNAKSRNDLKTSATKNGAPYLYANTNSDDHVTADSAMLHVSGKIFGLRITDVSSDAEWKTVFWGNSTGADIPDGTLLSVLPEGRISSGKLEKYRFYYTTGVFNELGLTTGRNKKFTLPMVDGCSPNASMQNSGMLKSGYIWSFELFTTGSGMESEPAYVVIEPGFDWICESTDGVLKRFPAEVYYSETFMGKLQRDVKISDEKDALNVKPVRDVNSGRLISEYTYGKITIKKPDYPINGNKMLQRYRFKYSLPAKMTVRSGGKRCRTGYLAVYFKVTAYDKNGKAYLSYAPEESGGYCNMWAMEGQNLKKADFYGKEFSFRYGDVVLLDLKESKGDDFLPDHRY